MVSLYIETPFAYILHAGFPTYRRESHLSEVKDTNDFLWFTGHHHQDTAFKLLNKVQVIGHLYTKEPFIGKRHVGLDTGCGISKTGKLTAFILPEKICISEGVENDF